MSAKPETRSDFIDDELVCYIARRHHLTPESLIRLFRDNSNDSDLKLEGNEVCILTDMGLKPDETLTSKPNT